MAKKLTIRTIRVAANVYEFDKTLTDANASASPASWRGNPLRIEIACFEKTGGDPLDLSEVAQITVTAKRIKSSTAPFIFSAIATVSTPLVERDAFLAGGFNAAVEIPGGTLDLAPDTGAESVELYMAITATTSAGYEVTLEAGTLVLHEDYNAVPAPEIGDWRVDAAFGPVFYDGAGWTNASGAAVDGHTPPELDPAFTFPASPLVGDYAFDQAHGHAAWFDGEGWVNESGAPVDGHTRPASDPAYVRPAYAGEGTMEFDRTLILPIWRIGGQWVNATGANI